MKIKKTVALLMVMNITVFPALSRAASTIPGFYAAVSLPSLVTNALPVPKGNSWQGVQSITQTGNQMVITQNQSQAIIDWNSFNIGATAAVYFSQMNAQGVAQPSWVAINRIYDLNPSLIYGNLKADGQIYLINRNGILFGPNSQVNVNALVASALNISNQNFTSGLLRFTTDDYTGSGGVLGSNVTVANYGTITTNNGGFVALVAPQAVNSGTISSPVGTISLIGVAQAAQGQIDVELIPNVPSTEFNIVYNTGATLGIATNTESGSLIADSGRVDMQGATVTQNGLIQAVSTVKTPGYVYLLASDTVSTGPTSLTSTPVSTSTDKVSQTFQYNGGTITLGGVYSSPDGTSGTTVTNQPLNNIIHTGDIEAPTGTVTLNAVQRIYLESGSTINVGGMWVDEPASANQVDAQLNSVQLADSYSQKNGILQGQNITTSMQGGSNIGNISGSYSTEDMTAQERSTTGGKIIVGAPAIQIPGSDDNYALSEFIAKQGATLNFSGGGFSYAAGVVPSTMLLSGTTAYNISNAPETLSYQAILGNQTVTHANGVTQDFSGIYLGGGTPLNQYVPAFLSGSNAGSLSVQARTVVLDSTLNGSVTRGPYQTNTTDPTANNGQDYATSVARGLEEPVGGTLTIGFDPGAASATVLGQDFITNSIEIQASSNPLPAGFGPGSQLGRQLTYLSAPLLSGAGLSQLNLYADTTITIDSGAKISLLPSGAYTNSAGSKIYLGGLNIKARSIIDMGEIDAPGDSVTLTLQDNVSTWTFDPNQPGSANALYVPLTGGILLDSGSRVSVAGETVDNSLVNSIAGGAVKFGQINGGSITVQDETIQGTIVGDSVIVRSGALLDVSGGYSISTSGIVTGGNAGSLTLRGATLSVAGDLRGFSLPGYNGGTITLHAGEIDVASLGVALPADLSISDPVPSQLQGKLILGESQLASTGFTMIELDAIHDVIFENGVSLAPSTVKTPVPVPAGKTVSGSLNNLNSPAEQSGVLSTNYVGSAYIKVTAGKNIYSSTLIDGTVIVPDQNATISVPSGTAVNVIPGGSISLSAPNISMAGILEALGGNISVTSTNPDNVLTISNGGEILAGGYNKPSSTTVDGIPAGPSPQSGGSVSLSSTNGIDLETGSLIDVSGSSAVQAVTVDANGHPVNVMVAGNPGSLTFNYAGTLSLAGEIAGQSRLAGVHGGTVTVNNADSLSITAADVQQYIGSGFDAITFKSTASLNFQNSMDISVGRSLTLDAPLITGGNYNDIKLSAPWIQVNNTSVNPSSSQGQVSTGDTATLTLSGSWLDVNGSVKLSGFSDVFAIAQQDIRLTDNNYTLGIAGNYNYNGNLFTDGNLTMQAERIYPTTLTGSTSNPFTISAGGQVTILPSGSGSSSPIYSAGGNLAINAVQGIEISSGSVLAAPMGNISLNSPTGRVYLAPGSLVTTSSDASVYYGTYDGTNWYGKDMGGGSADPLVTGAPTKSIAINGNEVIVSNGATLDYSGGGSIFTYLYQPDTQGTTNPISTVGISALTSQLTRGNRYVILPDNSVQLPGFSYTDASGNTQVAGAVYLNAIQLDNGTWLKAGTYSLLPAQFAFLPGALIISDTGMTVPAGSQQRTSDGYQIVAGYSTYLGTSIQSQVTEGYSVMPASQALTEGNFTVKQYTAGDAGSLSITGNSTIMAGSINAAPLSGFNQGSLSLNSPVITIQNAVSALPDGFNFTAPLPASFTGQLQLSASTLSGAGLGTLTLGDEQATSSVTVKSGSVLNVPNITLAAANSVSIEGGAQVNGVSKTGGGTVTILSPGGLIDIQPNAVVHASNALTMNANDFNLSGQLIIDSGSLNLSAGEIFFVPDSFTKSTSGLYLTEALWSSFSNCSQITLASRSDMIFQSDVNMSVVGALTLDAGQFTGPANVSFNATGNISLLNSAEFTGSAALSPIGSFTVNAGGGIQSQGNIAFNGFNIVNLESSGDLTLQGSGSLNTGGNLNITAARLTTSFFRDLNNNYNAADYTIAAAGAVNIGNSDGTAGSSIVPGGSLSITGSSITQSGIIQVASGQINLTATGGDISLSGTAQLLAQGSKLSTSGTATTGEYAYFPGGQISLSSNSGNVNLASGSVLNVSAADQGNAGSISLAAPAGTVSMAGTINGKAAAGTGGSFLLDTNSPSLDLSALNGTLMAGGFTGQIGIRARQGDLILAQGQTMTASEVMLEADSGAVTINGTISAMDGINGGRVDLNAQNNLTVTGSILASGTLGGEVFLNSESGLLIQGGVVDVTGSGGSVTLRALQNGSGINMSLPGQILGASQVVAEAFKVYSYGANYTISSTDENTWLSDAANYIAGAVMPVGWNSGSPSYHFRPGIEIQGSGDITLPSTLDLSAVRFNGEPGVLTLRAAGDLNINANLVDHPTSSYTTLISSTMQNSWGFNLVAGADLCAANPLAVNTAKAGNLTITAGSVVYSENAPINFAAANDATFNTGDAAGYMINSSMLYSLASYGGAVQGAVGNDLIINGGAIQTATGSIDIGVAGNLDLQNNGSIRTTGEYAQGTIVNPGVGGPSSKQRAAQISDYWTYLNGGSINLAIGGSVNGFVNNLNSSGTGLTNAWDYIYGGGSGVNLLNKHLAASFQGADSSAGIITMGGGDITVKAGGAFTSQIGAFGTESTGNLDIVAGGSLEGRFRVMNGTATLISGGAFGDVNNPQVIEMAKAQVSVTAQGDVYLGTVLDPDNTRNDLFYGSNNGKWNMTYGYNDGTSNSTNSSVSITSVSGSLTYNGQSNFDGYPTTEIGSIDFTDRQRILPPSVSFIAAGDINLRNNIYIPPSPTGNIRLFSGGSINGTQQGSPYFSEIFMTDKEPATIYGYQASLQPPNIFSDDILDKTLVHQGDTNPVQIYAGQDIQNLQLVLSKEADIYAGQDIQQLVYVGENIASTDVSSITAGRDINYIYNAGSLPTLNPYQDYGIQQGGPGTLIVQAGQNINLGNSSGIQSVANFYSPLLSTTGCGIIVAVGDKNNQLQPSTASAFFNNSAAFNQSGSDYFTLLDQASTLMGSSSSASGVQLLATAQKMILEYPQIIAQAQDGSIGLKLLGTAYSTLLSLAKSSAIDSNDQLTLYNEAQQFLAQSRSSVISKLFDAPPTDGSGSLSMTQSQICSLGSNSDIYIMAQGDVNVGKTALSSSSNLGSTGIYTAGGGAINIYSGGDINVNESRVMTFLGGDITFWSDQGNINAGRGSTTTISAASPHYNPVTKVTTFTPPAVGSGIRAVTYDPNTVPGGPIPIPEPGNIYVFAPKGIIDAGEAGIAGSKVVLGATQVLNSGNISFTSGSVGVPSSADSGVSIGSLAGTGNVTENSNMIEQTSVLSSAKDKYAPQTDAISDFMSTWLDVKVIDFDTNTDTDTGNRKRHEQDK